MVWRCILGLARPTTEIFAVPPRAPEVAVHSAIIGKGVTLCSFCSYLHNPGPCILGGWPLCLKWASFVARTASQDLSGTFYSSLKTLLFSRARVGSASE